MTNKTKKRLYCIMYVILTMMISFIMVDLDELSFIEMINHDELEE